MFGLGFGALSQILRLLGRDLAAIFLRRGNLRSRTIGAGGLCNSGSTENKCAAEG